MVLAVRLSGIVLPCGDIYANRRRRCQHVATCRPEEIPKSETQYSQDYGAAARSQFRAGAILSDNWKTFPRCSDLLDIPEERIYLVAFLHYHECVNARRVHVLF